MLTTICLFHLFLVPPDSLITRAESYFYKIPDSTIGIGSQILSSYPDLPETTLARTYNTLGFGFLQKGMNSLAYDYFLRAHRIYSSISDTAGLASTINYMANARFNQGELREALSYFRLSSIYHEIAGVSGFKAREFGNIGIVYQRLGQPDSSLFFIRKAISLYESAGSYENIAIFRIYEGHTLADSGLTDIAIQVLETGTTELTKLNKLTVFYARGLIKLAELYIQKKQFGKAASALDRAQPVIFNGRFTNEQLNYFQTRYKLEENLKNYQEMIRLLIQIANLKDSLRQSDIALMDAEYKHRINDEIKTREFDSLKKENEFNQTIQNGLIIGIMTLLIILSGLGIAIILYRRQRKVLENNILRLHETNKALNEALENVRELKGMIPICANCKKIRDDSGYWNRIEGYLMKHTKAEFTHGICPTCTEELYGKQLKD